MKHNVIRYSLIVLLIGLVALAAGRANAQGSESVKHIDVLSYSWGIAPGQTARISVANFVFGDGSVRATNPVSARIQLLDAEGEVIAQSDEIRVEPGKIRFWDVPRELIPVAGEPTGRIQMRTRILVTTRSFDVNSSRPPLAPTVELIDPGTGRTVQFIDADFNFGLSNLCPGSPICPK